MWSNLGIKDQLDLVFKVVAAAIAVFGVWKYFQDIERSSELASKRESLALIQDYSKGEISDAYLEIFEFWLRNPMFTQVISQQGSISDREYQGLVRGALLREGNTIRIDRAVLTISNFYDSVHFCQTSEVCEEDTLESYFCVLAARDAVNLKPFFSILNNKISSTQVGRGVHDYHSLCKGATEG